MTTITFSEKSLGTQNPVYTFSNNTVRTTGVIVNDGAQPASPVIAANTRYQGPVFIYFDAPVPSASVTVGYFDKIGSTLVEFYDATGKVLGSFANTTTGIQTFSLSNAAGIARIAAVDKFLDANGFSLDTLVFGDPIATLTPPTVSIGSIVLAPERDLGVVGSRPLSVGDSVGGPDAGDVFAFTAPSSGTATATIFLNENPTKKLTFNLQVGQGINKLQITPPSGGYAEAKAYSLNVVFSLAPSKDAKMDEWINEQTANILGGVLTFQEAKFKLLGLIETSITNSEDAAKLLGKIGATYSYLGLALDVANRIDAVSHAADYKKELFAQVIDMFVGVVGSGLIGTGVSFVGTPVAGILSGITANVIYTYTLSDQVKNASRDWYVAQTGGLKLILDGASFAMSEGGLSAAAPIDIATIAFDEAYYTATYASAREAVLSGQAASPYLHYIQIGAAAGYKPSASAAPIAASQIVGRNLQGGAAFGVSNVVFTAAAGALVGDGLSATETAFAAKLNDQRTDGTEFGIDQFASMLANRVARDWTLNHVVGPDLAFNASAQSQWAATLSNGKSLATSFSGLAGRPSSLNLSNLQMLAIYTPETDPAKVLQSFLTDPLSAVKLLGVDYKSIGIGEYGGVWVILFNPVVSTQAAPADTASIQLQLDGDDARDVFFAGGSIGILSGGGGADDLIGGAQGDTLKGGAGGDMLDGRGGDDLLVGGQGDDVILGGDGADTAMFAGKASEYDVTWTTSGWTVSDRRANAPEGRDLLNSVEKIVFADKTMVIGYDFSDAVEVALASVLRAAPDAPATASVGAILAGKVAAGGLSTEVATAEIVKAAASTTSVASLSYEFFTGKVPGQGGIDFLVSPTSSNPNNLNSDYYAKFNTVNRYINFAVNLGKYGEVKDSFSARYGGLSLFDATREAYKTIFGAAPTDAKIHALIDTRIDYFASYGGDGTTGIGTKAAMVGFLLAAAATEVVGIMAKSNQAWLTDLADGSAPFAVDILDPTKGYYKSDFIFGG